MNTSPNKYRHELKFLMNSGYASVLKQRLGLIMTKDTNSDANGQYYIRSLYFDDIYDTAYYEKIDGLEEREKYRIRFYNFDESYIVLELKGKKDNLTYKKQDRITKEEYQHIIDQNYDKIELNDRKVLEDFIIKCKLKNIISSIIVDYRRLAYTYPVEDIRITFDEDIASGRFDKDLFSKDIALHKVIEDTEVILEVKFNHNLPNFINEILETIPMTRIAMSKFALCKEKKEV